jgi:hypothetical protein
MALVMRRRNFVRNELGPVGIASLAMLALAYALWSFVVQPLEGRDAALNESVAAAEAKADSAGAGSLRNASPAAQLAAFYQHLTRAEEPTEWLAQLDALARESGIRLGTGDYRLQRAGPRLERYEVSLPVSGSYGQIRLFLEKALAQIPVMSVDQVTFRRESAGDPRVEAEARLAFHWVRP